MSLQLLLFGKYIKVRQWILAVLLAVVLLTQCIPTWGAYYAREIYPIVGTIVSAFSHSLPWAIGDLFIALSLIGIVIYPIYVHNSKQVSWLRALGHTGEYLLWVYVWFYAAWGLNYSQPDFYQRTTIERTPYNEANFYLFASQYIDSLNANYTEEVLKDRSVLCREAVEGYRRISRTLGVHSPFLDKPRVKTMLFSPLISMVGVSGSMGPFFVEFTVNGEVPAMQYPSTYTHEMAHWLGIASEAEANFYAYQVCTRSQVSSIRFSGYLSILPHVLSNASQLLSPDAYDSLVARILPEVKACYEQNRAYWQAKYSPFVGSIQHRLYELYLRGNKIPDGQKNYSQVIGLLLSYEAAGRKLQQPFKNDNFVR